MKDVSLIDLEKIAIDTLPVGCLTASAFRIPKYQRGYRWKKEDVQKLLDDLKEFLESTQDARSFYCLQPLVVKKSEEHPSEWEVVDGQQRLTTLFLIWNVLNGQAPYELSYDTRDRSKSFVEEIAGKTLNDITNIDFHHIYHAHQKIEDWFKGCCECMKGKFRALLADTNPKGRNVRFIWYRIQEGADADAPEDVFTRLNDRKIPLTDEELIRALFLSSTGTAKLADGAFQHRLALEWDRIETALREPDFWGFVSNETPPEGGRIRLLFQLCAPPPPKDKDKDHHLFKHYQGEITNPDKTPSGAWKEIIAYFEQLEEWYRDPELFHLVGYRATILCKKSTEALRKLLDDAKSTNDAKPTTKAIFATKLRQSIRTELVKKAGDSSISAFVSGLSYSTSPETRQTLALFNIATILRTKGVRIRFPFHLYHNMKVGWDIEHIQSRAGDNLKKRTSQEKWLEACKTELEHDVAMSWTENGQVGAKNEGPDKMSPANLIAEIDEFTKPGSSVNFPELEKKIRNYFGETESTDEEINDIGNLTLLDAPTNRGYGNAPFVVKRTKILEADRPQGTFILPCTRDLFLKVFSENAGNLRRWDIKNDGASHKAAICKTLKTFFEEK